MVLHISQGFSQNSTIPKATNERDQGQVHTFLKAYKKMVNELVKGSGSTENMSKPVKDRCVLESLKIKVFNDILGDGDITLRSLINELEKKRGATDWGFDIKEIEVATSLYERAGDTEMQFLYVEALHILRDGANTVRENRVMYRFQADRSAGQWYLGDSRAAKRYSFEGFQEIREEVPFSSIINKKNDNDKLIEGKEGEREKVNQQQIENRRDALEREKLIEILRDSLKTTDKLVQELRTEIIRLNDRVAFLEAQNDSLIQVITQKDLEIEKLRAENEILKNRANKFVSLNFMSLKSKVHFLLNGLEPCHMNAGTIGKEQAKTWCEDRGIEWKGPMKKWREEMLLNEEGNIWRVDSLQKLIYTPTGKEFAIWLRDRDEQDYTAYNARKLKYEWYGKIHIENIDFIVIMEPPSAVLYQDYNRDMTSDKGKPYPELSGKYNHNALFITNVRVSK